MASAISCVVHSCVPASRNQGRAGQHTRVPYRRAFFVLQGRLTIARRFNAGYPPPTPSRPRLPHLRDTRAPATRDERINGRCACRAVALAKAEASLDMGLMSMQPSRNVRAFFIRRPFYLTPRKILSSSLHLFLSEDGDDFIQGWQSDFNIFIALQIKKKYHIPNTMVSLTLYKTIRLALVKWI